MRRIICLSFLLCAFILMRGQESSALKVTQTTLSNGLTVWLNEDHSQPKVFGGVVVKAGAKDCPNTGIAHYFEHIMFKGTDKIGTTNYKAEKVYLDSIAAKYELLSQTKDEMGRRAIQKDINRLNLKASQYAIPNEFPNLVAKYGGSGLNAGTSFDYTGFYNTFSPQYIAQWAELYSERFINPVFRLFQGELETVYEEKNMYADNMITSAIEKAESIYFGTCPYAYPIIGSSENLKNPRLSDMEAFFKKYYVASNMGLILCGDFDSSTIIPLLEKTFGKIVRGVAPNRQTVEKTPLANQETVRIKVHIPLVKGEALIYSGPKEKEADAPALDLAVALLSNNNKTGYLDSLTNNNKLMMAMAMRYALTDAGVVGFGFVPNVPFGSLKKAEKMCMAQVERLKRGDFSTSTLEALKLLALRNADSKIENITDRAFLMGEVFQQDRTWNDYLAQKASIARLTKEDIVRVANKYFNDNYVKFRKKYGSYPKDNIAKPNFTPIKPKDMNVSSDYAKKLEEMPIKQIPPRLMDFNKDVETVNINPHATLYATRNPLNDLFSLSLIYHKGTLSDARLDAVAEYLDAIGTDSLSKQRFGRALQKLGTTLSLDATASSFSINISGFDRNLAPSLRLLGQLMRQPKNNEKALKKIITGLKMSSKSFDKDADEIAAAMLEKVSNGERSTYLTHMSIDEAKQLKGDDLLQIFNSLTGTECSVAYSGNLQPSDVAQMVSQSLPVDKAEQAGPDVHRLFRAVTEPVVYFYDMPSARQSIIQTYQTLKPCPNPTDRAKFVLWGNYFGNGFSSLLFQEIREFRAYAYYAYGNSITNYPRHAVDATGYTTKLSTQTDKTISALGVLDSLFTNMPVREKNIKTIKQEIINQINNSYPSFRSVGKSIAFYKRQGYTEDPRSYLVEQLPQISVDDVATFYKDNVARIPKAIIVVGNKKNLPMKELEKYGRIIELKKSDIYR